MLALGSAQGPLKPQHKTRLNTFSDLDTMITRHQTSQDLGVEFLGEGISYPSFSAVKLSLVRRGVNLAKMLREEMERFGEK